MLYSEFLQRQTGCPFCGSHNNRFIAENESVYLTYSLAPYHKHHLLVVPKRHEENILDLSEKEVADMEEMQETGLRLLKKLGYRNFSVLEREGDDSAKSVPHLHTNLIPEVRIGDMDHLGQPRTVMTDAEVSALMDELLPLK